MVTNFSVLNFLRTILVGGILDLLIKSQLLLMLRRDYRCFLVSISRLNDETETNLPEKIEDKLRTNGPDLLVSVLSRD